VPYYIAPNGEREYRPDPDVERAVNEILLASRKDRVLYWRKKYDFLFNYLSLGRIRPEAFATALRTLNHLEKAARLELLRSL